MSNYIEINSIIVKLTVNVVNLHFVRVVDKMSFVENVIIITRTIAEEKVPESFR